MTTKLALFLATRKDAFRRGDKSVFKAMTAEVQRLGYVEPEPLPSAEDLPPLEPSALSQIKVEPMETTAVGMPERAVPEPPRRGRPPLNRTEE